MNEQYISDLYNSLGGQDVFGDFKDFKSLITTNEDYASNVYNELGGESVFGKYDDFSTVLGLKKKGVSGQGSQTGSEMSDTGSTLSQDSRSIIRPETETFQGLGSEPQEGISFDEKRMPKQEVNPALSYLNIFSKTIADLPSDIGEAWSVASAFIERGLGELGVPGANKNLSARDLHAYKLSDDWRKFTEEVYPVNEGDRNTFLGGVAQGLGQAVPMVMTGGIAAASKAKVAVDIAKNAIKTGTKISPFIKMGKDIAKHGTSTQGLIGGSQMSSAVYREAVEGGATEDQALRYAIENFLVGTVAESMPIQSMFSRISKKEPKAHILRILKEGITGFGEEAITEMWQTTYENWSAQRIYDFNREMLDGVGDAGAIGGTTGFILNAAMTALTGKRSKVRTKIEQDTIDAAIADLKSKIETVENNNRDIVEIAEALDSLEPVRLSFGSMDYEFVRNEDGVMELAEDPMTKDQAESLAGTLGNSYTGLEFTVQEIAPENEMSPVTYNVTAKKRSESSTDQKTAPDKGVVEEIESKEDKKLEGVETRQKPPISEMKGQSVTVDIGGENVSGIIDVDEGGKVSLEFENKVYELDPDIDYKVFERPVSVSENGDFVVNGESFVEARVTTENGKKKALLIREDNTTKAVTNDNLVEEIEKNIALSERIEATNQRIESGIQSIPTNSVAEIDRVKASTNPAGDGATFNLDGTTAPSEGLVVPVVSKNLSEAEMTPQAVADFVAENKSKIGNDEAVKVGIYKFPDGSGYSIDLNVLIKPGDKKVGLEFGKAAGQESLFNLETNKGEPTGADGKNPMSFSDTQFKEIANALKEGRIPDFMSAKKEEGSVKPGNRLFNKPLADAAKIANDYFKKAFKKARPVFTGTRKLDIELSKRISDAYEAMKHDPNNPRVREAYNALAKETLEQYNAFTSAGYVVEINNNEPYANSAEMIEDLRANKRIKIFSTESGFGDTAITEQQRKENPLLKDSGLKDANGQTLLINDLFRAVHDFFGHSELGNSFGAKGEENAWNVHARMFSKKARAAMTSETRGQNSYVNFSGVNKKIDAMREEARKLREEGKTKEAETIVQKIYEEGSFAEQKVGLLPSEFWQINEKDTGDAGIGVEAKQKDTPLSIKDSIDKSAQALKLSFPNTKFIVGENLKSTRENIFEALRSEFGDKEARRVADEFNNAAGQALFVGGKPVAVVIDSSTANSRTAAHEVWEVILNQAFNNDNKKFEQFRNAIDRQLRSNGFVEIAERLTEFSEGYDGPDQFREYMAEFGGMLTSGELNIDTETLSTKEKGLIGKVKDLINKFSQAMIGQDVFLADATEANIIDFMTAISKSIAGGKDIKTMIGGSEGLGGGLSIVSRLQANFSDAVSKMTFTYAKNSDKFERLKEKGFITNDKSIFDFKNKSMVLHSPDAAFSGEISKMIDGEMKTLIKGKGGIFFPINFHDQNLLWASTKQGATTVLNQLRKASDMNGGTVYMALTAAPSDKLLSSTTSANGILDFFDSKVFNDSFGVTPAKFKVSLRRAANYSVKMNVAKKEVLVGLNMTIDSGATVSEIKSAIKERLNPDNSTFQDRKMFVDQLVGEMSNYIKASEQSVSKFGQFFSEGIRNKYFKGKTKTGKIKISKANMLQALSDMMTEPMLKGAESGEVYAVLEVKGPIRDIDSDVHESYPKSIQADNPVTLHLLKDRVNWKDVFTDSTTGDFVNPDTEKKVYPSSGVSTRPMNVASIESRSQQPDKKTPSSFEAAGPKGKALFEAAVAHTNSTAKYTDVNAAIGSGIILIQSSPEYKKLLKEDADFITTDAMIREFQSFMGLSMKRAPSVEKLFDIPTEGKAIRQEIKRNLKLQDKGARQLQRLKVQMRNFIWHNIPKADYSKSEVMSLIQSVNDAKTIDSLDPLMQKVLDLATEKKSSMILRGINKLLNTKYTAKEGSATVGKKISPRVKELIDYINSSPDRDSAVERLEKVIEKAQNENRQLTRQELDEVMAGMVSAQLSEASNLESESLARYQALSEAYTTINAIINGGRSELKAELNRAHERYVENKKIAYQDIAGQEFDMSDQGADNRANKELSFDQKKKKERQSMIRKAIGNIGTKINSYFMKGEALYGLVDIISKGPGEMFGGRLQELVTDKIDLSSYVYKDNMLTMKEVLVGKAQELFGKKYQSVIKKNREERNTGWKLKGGEELILSQDQAAYLYNQFKNENNRSAFVAKYPGQDIDAMMKHLEEKFLTPERKAYSDWMVDELFPSLYDKYNAVHLRVNRANLPWNSKYAGRLYREIGGTDPQNLLDDVKSIRSSTSNGSMKERVQNNNPIKEMNEMDALFTYIKDMEFYHAYAENVRDVQKIFADKDIRSAIKQTSGEDVLSIIDKKMKNIIGRGMASDATASVVNAMTDVFVTSRLGINPVVGIKQLTSAVAFSSDIGIENWLAYGPKSIGSIRSTWSEITRNSSYIRDRYDKSLARSIEAYSDTSMSRFVPQSSGDGFMDKVMWFAKQGDKGGIMGGIPNYLYHKDQFKKKNPKATEQKAIDYAILKFNKSTKQTQQSNDIQDRDLFQDNPNLRFLQLFMTSPKQYLRKEISSVRQLVRKVGGKDSKGSVRNNLENFIMYHTVLPMMFQYITAGLPGLLSDWEKDDTESMARAAVLGNLNGLFIFGDIITSVADFVENKPWAADVNSLPILQSVSNIVKNSSRWRSATNDESKQKYKERAMYEAASLSGLPAAQVNNIYKNLDALMNKNESDKVKALRILNFSQYVIDNAEGKDSSIDGKQTGIDISKISKKDIERIKSLDPDMGREIELMKNEFSQYQKELMNTPEIMEMEREKKRIQEEFKNNR